MDRWNRFWRLLTEDIPQKSNFFNGDNYQSAFLTRTSTGKSLRSSGKVCFSYNHNSSIQLTYWGYLRLHNELLDKTFPFCPMRTSNNLKAFIGKSALKVELLTVQFTVSEGNSFYRRFHSRIGKATKWFSEKSICKELNEENVIGSHQSHKKTDSF